MATRIGLVSDTHRPERCPVLPPGLFEVLNGVDLVLHAGDLGELWVLDEIGRIAPVFAVHGNDDTADAQRELPYHQIVAVGGRRILLCHSHRPDRAEEMAARRDDAWESKLARWTSMARRVGADVFVFGHTHIPMTHEHDGVLLVNPGAIASGGPTTRQIRQTVARLVVDAGEIAVEHVDLAEPAGVYSPTVDWAAGFRAALDRYSASILEPSLVARWDQLLSHELRDAAPFPIGRDVVLRVARRVWAGEREWITLRDLAAEFAADDRIDAEQRRRVLTALDDDKLD